MTTTGDPPHTPGFGSKENNIFNSRTAGVIKRLMKLPCATPPSVYVETAIPAALAAFWGYLSPDPRELYHKAFGHSALCEVKGAVLEGHVLPPPDESKLTRFLFNFGEVVDLQLWYYFLGSLAADFVLDWTTGIEKNSPCSDIRQKEGNGTDPFGGSFSDGIWGTFDFSFPPGRFFPAGPPGFGLAPGETGMIACQCTFQDVGGVPVQGESRINFNDGEYILDYDKAEPLDGGGYRPTIVFGQASNGIHSTTTKSMEWQCTTAQHLPHGELFPRSGQCFIAKFR